MTTRPAPGAQSAHSPPLLGPSRPLNDAGITPHHASPTRTCIDRRGTQGLHIAVETPRLQLRSVEATPETIASYARMMGSDVVMRRFGSGQPLTAAEVATRVGLWAKRWADGDPYTGLSIYHRSTGEFYGHIVLGHSGVAGQAELAYLADSAQWGQGLMGESVTAVLEQLAPALQNSGCLLEGVRLTRVCATARPDNVASCRLLERAGFRLIGREEKFGAERNHYIRALAPPRVQPCGARP